MTKLPKIERCVCGHIAKTEPGMPYGWHLVVCQNELVACWSGSDCQTKREAILAWNRVMSAAKKAKVKRAK